MRIFKRTTWLMACLLVFTSITACAEQPIDKDDENVEGSEYLDYGELLPGPDYSIDGDETYRRTVLEQGGPITAADWSSLDQFEEAMNEASSAVYASLPTYVAEEFPGLTEAERNQLISDFQAAVATSFLTRDDPNSADCIEIYAENELTGEPEWQPLCDSQLGPEFKGRVLRFVRVAAEKAWAGRHAVKDAAVAVGNFATRQAGNVRRVAGQVVGHVKQQAVAIGNRAIQMAQGARMAAAAGWNAVKMRYAQAHWAVKAAATFAAWEGGLWVAENVAGWAWRQVFGGPQEATETTDVAVERVLGADTNNNLDALFDR